MRLARLSLDRYGKFTDAALDFGPAPEGGAPDLHLVFGPNEAGKSTALNACLDLFFGIEPRSRYDFIHDYKAMRIGAILELDGASHDVARIKSGPHTLLARGDRPADEGLLAAALAGLDRTGYRAMFSLDETTLEDGGESVLASEGDLGRLLFGASAGLTEIDTLLAAIRAEIDAFHRPKARKSALADAKRRLEEHRRARREFNVSASAHARAVSERDAAAAAVQQAVEARAETARARDALHARLAALPRLAKLRQLRVELDALGELPRPVAGLADDLPDLLREETTLATDLRLRRETLARLDEALADLALDQAVLDLSGRIDALGGRDDAPGLEARAVTAEDDIPRKRLELAEAEAALTGLRQRLGVAAEVPTGTLVLPATRTGLLRDLVERHAGLAAGLEAARQEARKAEAALARAVAAESDKASVADGGPQATDPAALAELKAARDAAAASDHATRKRLAESRAAVLVTRLAERMARLAPWSGDPADLTALAVPGPARLARWQETLPAATRRSGTAAEAERRAIGERERLRDERDRLAATAVGIRDAEATGTRAARDAAWVRHRASLDAATADAFAEAMATDDDMVAARLARATELAALAEAEAALRRAEAEVATASEEAAEAREALAALEAEVAGAIAALAPAVGTGLPADTGLAGLLDWLDARARAVETVEELAHLRGAAREAEAEGTALTGRLRRALTPFGGALGEGGPETLLTRAETVLEAAEETGRAEAEAARVREGLEAAATERSLALAAVEEALAEWTAAWDRALAGSWLATGDRTPGAVARALDVAADLPALAGARDSLAARIAAMEADRTAYATEVAAIAIELGEDRAAAPRTMAGRLRARLEEARRVADRRRATETERAAAARALETTSRANALLEARRKAIAGALGVETLAEASAVLERVRRRDALESAVAEEARELAALLGTDTAEEAEALLAGAEKAALEDEAAALEATIADRDAVLTDRLAARTRAEDALAAIGHDDRVARLELAIRTELLGIEADARAHLAARFGLMAAERALAAYRDRHRSEMLEHASAAFSLVTGGAWEGLATQPGDGREELIALLPAHRGGGSRRAGELSKGTRFQLYLALRVAGYRSFATHRRPPPFLGDDIFETFDDERSAAAFALLAGMARHGQVIYLTHHAHLIEIARAACPGVRVHRLPGEGTPAGPVA